MDVEELRARVNARLAANDPEGAFAVLEPAAASLDRDPALALLWATLLARTPARTTLLDEARRILDAFPTTPELVIAVNAALVHAAERRPMDEPPLREDGPAHLAAAAAARCLEALPEAAAADPAIAGYLWINRANALRLAGVAHDQAAQEAFGRALALDPANGHWWFDAGLLHKWRGRFEEALQANLRARARLGETRAVQWNIAICATASGQGDLAAGVWKALGMPAELAPSGMPFVDGLPPVQVRVISRGAGIGPRSTFPDRAAGFEVVWMSPLSPCHGVVASPTFRDAPIDYGDLVVWDGAPVGVATLDDGARVPRFPLLEVLKRGDERKLRFVALTDAPHRIDLLEAVLPEGVVLFAQRERIESARPVAGTGGFLSKHREEREIDRHLFHGKIVAPVAVPVETIQKAIESLKSQPIAVAVPDLYDALPDTKRAGQEHQAFRGIERRAEKRFGAAG